MLQIGIEKFVPKQKPALHQASLIRNPQEMVGNNKLKTVTKGGI